MLNPVDQTIKLITTQKQFGSSFIFSGPRGTGKVLTVKQVARELNIKPQDLQSYFSIKPQIIKNKDTVRERQILIDQIRQALDFMRLKSPQSQYKICVIHKAEKMNLEAQNALLKNLEQPKTGNLYFLLTENDSKLLTTIRSRSQKINFSMQAPELIFDFLQKQAPGVELQTLKQSVFLGWGRKKLALKLTQSPSLRQYYQDCLKELSELLSQPEHQRLNLLEQKTKNTHQLLKSIDVWIVFLIAYLETNLTGKNQEYSQLEIPHLNFSQFSLLLNQLVDLRKKIKYTNSSARLASEAVFLQI
ncbi:MAG: AAA family ATPase [Candidatus Moranbacteria bacterium]|nr:AAA family ATPase [Candidatus Moranbacteria bacterium]